MSCTCNLINILSVFQIRYRFLRASGWKCEQKISCEKSFVYKTNEDRFPKTYCHGLISEIKLAVKKTGQKRSWTIPIMTFIRMQDLRSEHMQLKSELTSNEKFKGKVKEMNDTNAGWNRIELKDSLTSTENEKWEPSKCAFMSRSEFPSISIDMKESHV